MNREIQDPALYKTYADLPILRYVCPPCSNSRLHCLTIFSRFCDVHPFSRWGDAQSSSRATFSTLCELLSEDSKRCARLQQ